jgi:hypothetical protein
MISIIKICFVLIIKEKQFWIEFLFKNMIIVGLIISIFISNNFIHSRIISVNNDLILKIEKLLSILSTIFIISNFSLGVIKNIPGDELRPFLNLPINKNLLLIQFLTASYFDFSFLIMILLPIWGISIIENIINLDLVKWITTILIYSIIFQQFGILLRLLNIRLIIKLLLLTVIFLGVFVGNSDNSKFPILIILAKSNLFIIYGLIIYLGTLWITKNQLFNNLINYLE